MTSEAAGRLEACSLPTRRIPVFVGAQAECATCGEEIADPLALEEFGRYCSARCYHGRGLPAIFRQGA